MRRAICGLALLLACQSTAQKTAAPRAAHAADPLAEVRHETNWTNVEPAPEPAGLPLLSVLPEDGTGTRGAPVDRPALRSLLVNRRFARLTSVLESFQAAFEADPRKEDWISDAYEVLGYAHPTERELIEAWIAATPRSFAPYLARGAYWVNTAFLWRGTAFSRDTSDSEFGAMHEAFAQARQDLNRALSLRPGLIPARALLIKVEVADGDRTDAERVLEQALSRCPTCYHVRTTWLWALLPRWTGSLEEMEAFASTRVDPATPRHRFLSGFVELERAAGAASDGDRKRQLTFLDRACAVGGDYRFFMARADARGWSNVEAYLADLQRAEAVQPGVSEVAARRASTLAMQNRWEEAGRDLLGVLRARPTSRLGNWLHPTLVRSLDAFAWKQHQAGSSEEAARLYRLARALAPEDAQVADHARVVARAGHPKPSAGAAAPARGDARPVLKVQVVDAHGRPVPGAQLVLQRSVQPGMSDWEHLQRMAAQRPRSSADDQGRLASPAEVGPWFVMAIAPQEPVTAVVASVPVTTTGATVRLALGASSRIQGSVTDAQHRPVAGVQVLAIPDVVRLGPEPRALAAAASREDGSFSIEGLDSGGYRLFAMGRGYVGRASGVALEREIAGGAQGVAVEVAKVRTIRGRVLVSGPEGTAPAQRFKVTLPTAYGEFSGQDGRYSLETSYREPEQLVRFEVNGRPPVTRRVRIGEGETDLGDVTIGKGRKIRGRVLDPRGYPVADASVKLRSGNRQLAVTSGEGTFEAVVPEGNTELEIWHSRWADAFQPVGADQQDVEVRLRAGGSIKILSLDPAGSPIPGVTLSTSAGQYRERVCTTDATGRCEANGLEPGDYDVLAFAGKRIDPNAPVPPSINVHVGAGEERGVRVRWPKEPSRFEVRVLDKNGELSPRGACLLEGDVPLEIALRRDDARRPGCVVAPAGRPVENLAPGRYTVVALGIWGLPACAIDHVDVRERESGSLTLTLRDDGCR